MQTPRNGPTARKGPAKGWKHPLCEFASNKNGDCNIPLHPHGFVLACHRHGCHYQSIGKLAGLFVTVSLPHLSAASFS